MKTILIPLLLCCTITLSAQSLILIKGQIIDGRTEKPIAYAHVGIPERGIGTTTASNGTFLLKVPSYYKSSKLKVSFIGYKTFERPISSIDKYLTIKLQSVSTDLQEILVMDESRIENIVEKAVRNIPNNYPTYNTRMTGFYRESKTDEDQRYVYMAEGVLDVYKTSYKNKRDGQLSLIEGRKVDLVPEDSMRNVGFTSGHWSSHRFDFVKNREDFIDKRYFPVYKYWLTGITEYNGRPVYIISFDKDEEAEAVEVEKKRMGNNGFNFFNIQFGKKKSMDHARLKGKMYIDTASYAFLRAEFEFRKEALRRYDNYPLYRGNWKGNKYVVNYRKVGDKWYFSESLREGLYRDGGLYSNEFVVTEIEGKGQAIAYLDRLENHIAFRRNTGAYDPDFWRDYNVTLLNDKLDESVQQLQRRSLAGEVFDTTRMAAEQRIKDSLKLAEIKQLELEGLDLDVDEMGDIRIPTDGGNNANRRRRRNRVRFQMQYGLGTHLLSSEAASMSVSYQIDEANALTVSGDIKAREFEVVAPLDFSLVFKDKWFVRVGYTPEFYNSIYKQNSYGVGWQFNLSKGRPFYVKPIVSFTDFKYARKIGQTENDFGKFKADDKKIREGKVNMYYGNRTFNVKGTLELAIELNFGTEFFLNGSYLYPFATQDHIYLWERKRVFRRKDRIELDQNVFVEKNDAPFRGDIAKFKEAFMVSAGIIKKF